MEDTALYRLLMSAFILLLAQEDHSYSAQTPDAAFPHIAPDRLQFFEYESISIRCEDTDGFTDWTVMRKLRKIIQTNSSEWNMSAPAHTIYPAFERDSGEYWCESEEGGRSNAINITVTGGSVILETPAHPVMEGVPVTLRCKKRTSSGHISEFFKDGLHFEMGYKGEVTILNVSTSHEGLYKCIMPGAGESPESRLAVTDFSAPHEEARPPPSRSRHLSLLWPLLGVLLLVLLLLMGLLHYQKAKVPGENGVAEPRHATYAVVKKHSKKKVSGGGNTFDPDDGTYAAVNPHMKKKERSRPGTRSASPEDSIYSQIIYRPVTPD